MKPTFLVTLHHILTSALIPLEQPHALQLGDCLRLEETFETPWGPVPAGTEAYVEHVDDSDGIVELAVPTYVPALEPWGRRIVLMPYVTDDIVTMLRLIPRPNIAVVVDLEAAE